MISLGSVEAVAQALWPEAGHAAAAVPDPRKGERILLFTTEAGADRGALQAAIRKAGLSDLAAPAEICVVDAIPLLGSGKTDHVAVTRLAEERARENAA